jgi:CPA2 family monovalent cation:H+ antiporter-2
MISVSSTMVVLKVMVAEGVTNTLASKVMIGMLLVQDLAVIPMLIILPQLGNPDGLAARVGGSLALASAILAATFFAGTRLLPPLFRRILSWGSRELFLVAVVATAVGIGAAMHAAGLSFALGAFVAGLILSESEFSHQALSDVVPLRDIFGLLFFVTVGMLFDPNYAMAHPGLILLAVAAIIAGKAVIFGFIARLFGYQHMAPWIVGLGLSQIGEFSFVLARTGFNGQMISKGVYDLALTATVLTMAASPVVTATALPMGRAWRKWRGVTQPPPPSIITDTPLRDHVVVAGFGRTGRAVASALREAEIPFLVVESSYALMSDVTENGFLSLWGDIAHDEILHAAHLHDANMLLLTMPDQNTVNLAVERARRMSPEILIVARSTNVRYLQHLRELGVSVAVQPEFEGGLEMVRQGLLRCGRDEADTARIVERIRHEIYQTSD